MKFKEYRIILTCALFAVVSLTASAQQQIQLTQNIFNIMSYNPGYMGHRNAINILGTIRSQWTGFGVDSVSTTNSSNKTRTSYAPVAYLINADLPITFLHGGVGINITSDNIGSFSNVTMNLGYAYQKVLVNGGKLGIGVQLKLDNIVLDKNSLNPNAEDPLISNMNQNDFMADANLGVFYSKPNSLFGGISVLNLLETKGKNTFYQEKRSFNALAGYEFRLTSLPKIKFTPSILLKTDLATFQIDANILATFNDKFWGGVNYRLNDGIGLIFGLSWKDLMASFSYDIPMSKLIRGGTFGSFEVVLGYGFKFNNNKGLKTQKNTRYL